MAREEKVRVSSKEKEMLDTARQEIFGSDAVPYGEVIAELCENYDS